MQSLIMTSPQRIRQSIASIIGLLAFGGLLNALAIFHGWYGEAEEGISCVLGGGCDTVLSSPYASLFSIPLSVWGVAYYLTILIIVLVFLGRRNIYTLRLLMVGVVCGLAFSLYLFLVQAMILGTFCSSCLLSFADVILMTGIVIGFFKYIAR